MSRVPGRQLVGPSLIALATWCAAGTLSLASVDTPERIVVPAPAGWLVAGWIAAWFVRPWRRRPLLTSPALLSIVPWLPVPVLVPGVAFIWTGLLAWAPIGLAVLAALVPSVRTAEQVTPGARPRLDPWLAALVTCVAGGLALGSVHPRLPGGDEPHYLIVTQSLLADGDLRVENNYAQGDHLSYWGGPLPPHAGRSGRDGQMYSIHAPGVSVLVAPAFALFGVPGAQLTMLLLVSVGGAFVWMAGWYGTRRRSAAWFAWASIAGSLTFVVQSITIFPDGPGAAVVAVAVATWLRLQTGHVVSNRSLVLTSALLAVLPFLHTRLSVLAAVLGLGIGVQLWRSAGPSPVVRRRLSAFLAVPGVAAVIWFGYFVVIYGTPNPVTPYGSNTGSSLAYIPGGMAGLLFDQQFGLLAHTPVLVLALVGWFGRRREIGVNGRWPGLMFAATTYLAAVASYWMWWAGSPAPPARFATAMLPLLAAPVAGGWATGGAVRRAVSLVLLTGSLAMTVVALTWRDGDLAWSVRDGRAGWLLALDSLADLPRALPSFFWGVIGGDVRSEWIFGAHLLVWLAAMGAAMFVVKRAQRTGAGLVSQGTVLAWMLALAVMAASQAGWWLTGAAGVEPSRSQLAVLRQAAHGRAIWQVTTFGVQPVGVVSPTLQVTLPRTDLPHAELASWAALDQVPAGRYQLRISGRRPSEGSVAIRVSYQREPLATVALPWHSVHTVDLHLPIGADRLVVDPDVRLAATAGRIDLVPLTDID